MTVEALFASYQAYHRNPKNKLCHYIGIPTIVYGILNFLRYATFTLPGGLQTDLALVFGLAVLAFYAWLNVRLALAMVVFTAPLYFLALVTPWQAGLAVFLGGWVVQFIGHYYEGKKPAFFTNALHLLIGPLWICSHLMEKAGLWSPKAVTA